MSRARWRDIAAAGHLGDRALADAALADADPDSRELALGALQRMGALDAATLSASLLDSDAGVRRRAALLAAHHREVDLLHTLDDPDPTVVEAAAWACGEHEQVVDAVLERLVALAGDHDAPLVREAAVAALGAIGDHRGLPAILAGCTDKPAVRRRAVLALAPFDGDDVVAALHAALTDRDWQVRQAAEDVLAAAGIEPPASASAD
jgi:HEAT repeat protein